MVTCAQKQQGYITVVTVTAVTVTVAATTDVADAVAPGTCLKRLHLCL
jgi:hypothetical protein